MQQPHNPYFVYTRQTPYHIRFLGFFLIVFMFAAIPVIVLLAGNRTNDHIHAAPSTTILVSSTQQAVIVGKQIPVTVAIDPGNNYVSVVKLSLSYDPAKIATSGSFIINTLAFPETLSPTVHTCDPIACHISFTVSIGSNPTKVIQAKTLLGTMEFVAIAPADQTQISVGSNTQVFSTNSNDLPTDNVLSTTNALTIAITDPPSITPNPTPIACGGFVQNPPTCPSGYICDHTGVLPDLPGKCILPSATPSMVSGGDAFASISLMSPGISAKQQLEHATRSVTITLYNIETKKSYTTVDTVTFDGVNSFTNPHFNLGAVPRGIYQLLLAMPQHLEKLLTQADNTNVFLVQPESTIPVPKTALVIGDIAPIPGTGNQPFGDNVLDISDYNLLISCYGVTKPDTCSDVARLASDLNDDGKVDAVDYNILLRSFATRSGDSTPPVSSIGSGSPTPKPTCVPIAPTCQPGKICPQYIICGTPTPLITALPTPTELGPTPTTSTGSGSTTCTPRPWCLDHAPLCYIAEPANGWCAGPSNSPTPSL